MGSLATPVRADTHSAETPVDAAALDGAIIDRAKSGDRDAVTTVLQYHYERIHRLLVHLVGPTPDLDDLRQAVLLAVVQNLPHFRGEGAISTWIAGICINVVKTHFRRKRLHRERTALDPSVVEAPSGENLVKRLESRQQLQHTEAALERLSPAQRMVFVLATVYGHSIPEIAEITKSARSTTRMRLYYGRKAFFSAMAEFRTEGV